MAQDAYVTMLFSDSYLQGAPPSPLIRRVGQFGIQADVGFVA